VTTTTAATATTTRPAGAREGKPVSPVTSRAVAFVAARRGLAETRGAALAEESHDPDAFAVALRVVLEELADPEYREGSQRVAPGLGPVYGVRWPLMAALARGFRAATRDDPDGPLLYVADRLFDEDRLEPHWFAFGLLERTLRTEPERTWQLLRRAARHAADWITVDSLAHPYATGIAAEPYRWAELELLTYSPSRWERRLIGSTIATLTHGSRGKRLGGTVVTTALPILEQLMGDAEPDVQKALAWAYRSLADVDRPTTTAALEGQADIAARTDDGHRAWVVRDTLAKLTPEDAERLRLRLAGIRRRPGAPSTSPVALTAARFGPLPDPATHPDPPLR
jgi:3-methyladenine DNA glycosylase AlkD